MSQTKRRNSGRRGLGQVLGFDGEIRADDNGRLREYRVRLGADQCRQLRAILRPGNGRSARAWLSLTATRYKPRGDLNRVRVSESQPPAYEQRAASAYLPGDLVRVVGTKDSCNLRLPSVAVDMFCDRLRAAEEQARNWLELRARVTHRREESSSYMVEFVPDIDIEAAVEDRLLGKTGAALAAQMAVANEFRDWEDAGV